MQIKDLKVGSFLAARQLKRSSKWTTFLIVAVMTLTFLNLVVVSGILVGLIEGAVEAVKSHYLGDVIIGALKERPYIDQSTQIINAAKALPGVAYISPRYLSSGQIEGNYKEPKKRPSDLSQSVGATVAGIDPYAENQVTNLKKVVIEGSYLNPGDYDEVLLGAMLLKKYLNYDSSAMPVLDNVGVGSKVRITVAGSVRDVLVKGIVKSKVDELDRRVFFVDSQLRGLIGRTDYNVSEIAIKLSPGTDPVNIRDSLLRQGFGQFAKIQTQDDAEPKFIKDMKQTFAILGNVIGSIGLAVAAITIFIIIFINAVTRRKYIGILKGIGVRGSAIEFSYILQALSYAIAGSIIGILMTYLILVPFFRAHPINFPFSDGILVAPLSGTMARAGILLLVTLAAGYLPARLIVQKNTLDSILGRN